MIALFPLKKIEHMEIRSNTDNLEKGIRYLRKYPTYFKKNTLSDQSMSLLFVIGLENGLWIFVDPEKFKAEQVSYALLLRRYH